MRASYFLNPNQVSQAPIYRELVESLLQANYAYACSEHFSFIKVEHHHNGCMTHASIVFIKGVIFFSATTLHVETEKTVITQFHAYSNEECMEALKRLFSATIKSQSISVEKPYLAFSGVDTNQIAKKWDNDDKQIIIGQRPNH